METTGTSYVAIQDWMYATLRIDGKRLSLAELSIYAVIHGFCMNGDTLYYGKAKYIEDLLGIPKTTYYRVVDNLVKAGLVVRQKVSFDSIPRTVLFTAVSRNMTPEEAIAQSTPKPPAAQRNTPTPVPNESSDSHSGTPTPTMGLPSDSHSGTANSHSGTDPGDNKRITKEITTENNTYSSACARYGEIQQPINTSSGDMAVTDTGIGENTATSTHSASQPRELQSEFLRLWNTTADNKCSCLFSFTSGFADYKAWTRLWAERPWSLEEMHRAFQNIADAVNSGILERKFIPRHPDRLAMDLGRYLEPLKARPSYKASSGFGIELNDGGKAAIIKKCMARH